MTFSREWEEAYAAGRQNSIWPWTDLVCAVMRHCPDLRDKRVLELGCGVGANIPFFRQMGAKYIGIEGSSTAAEKAMTRYAGAVISVGDFTKTLPYENCDLVVDRSSIVHNEPHAIENCLDLVHDALKPGGLFISIDWFSTAHEDEAQFDGLGVVHRVDEEDLRAFLHGFEIVSLEEKLIYRVVPECARFASWNIVTKKPA